MANNGYLMNRYVQHLYGIGKVFVNFLSRPFEPTGAPGWGPTPEHWVPNPPRQKTSGGVRQERGKMESGIEKF